MHEVVARKTIILLAATVLVPPAIMSVYLIASRWPNDWFDGVTDWIAIGGSVVVGATALYRLSDRLAIRVVSILIYLPLMSLALLFFSLAFVCNIFGHCP